MKSNQLDYSKFFLDYYSKKKHPDSEMNVTLESDTQQYQPVKHKKGSKQFALSSGC
ncbi:MAG: hypothetical protein HQK75_11310 [Candidatus Magnetomorum sp.]|nr:hypothetical protein [Candidatus Magnetomorum sp.]